MKPTSTSLQRELSLLPEISPENQLARIQTYYSFIGAISDSQIQGQNSQIMAFAQRARRMLDFMLRFQKQLHEMESEFEQGVTSTYQLNQLMSHYEQTLFQNYSHKLLMQQPRVFTPAITEAMEQFPSKVQNPFKVMIRWLKFEISDIEAILEAISKKNAMD